jgi:hypothetical protein
MISWQWENCSQFIGLEITKHNEKNGWIFNYPTIMQLLQAQAFNGLSAYARFR